ncbi:MAG: sigma-70 family RNA polymerase sigma factor [Bacteroidota bacterium]
MAAVAHGELERLAELYQRYRNPLFGYLYRQVKGDRSLAEDVLQDTFERIIKYRASYRPNSSFRAWVYTLARNACNDRLRKANRLPCDSDISPKDLPLTTPSILQDLLQKEEIQRVKKALNNLPDKYREVIDLAWKRKMKYAEIGELLSLSEANVKVRVHRAIKHLKANYQKIPEEMQVVTEAILIDYLQAELCDADRQTVEARLAIDPLLQAQLDELKALQELVVELSELQPSTAMDQRFASLLATAKSELVEPIPQAKVRRIRPWRIAAAAAVLLLVFAAGWYFGSGAEDRQSQVLAANRALMLELMKDERTSARVRATSLTLDLEEGDPEIIANLAYLLCNDENTNVRLAALAAIKRFSQYPIAREELLNALNQNPPEVVRLQLIETLVHLEEKRVLPLLEDLIENDSVPQHLRDAARMGTFKLI